jgi:hypothetical protein
VRHRLPWLGIVLVIGACELKPAPKQQPQAPAAATGTAAAGAPAPPPAPAPGSGAAPAPAPAVPAGAPEDLGQACMQIGVRVAGIMIASATDPVMKAQLEQARADTVRSTAEACVRGKWDADVRRCFLTASSQAEITACSARTPGPAASKPTRGS